MTNVVPASTYLSHFEKHTEKANIWRPLGAPKACFKDEETQLQEAYRRGLSEGRSLALTECEAQYAIERKEAAAAHARERASWLEAEGRLIAGQLSEGLMKIESRISSLVARIIEPLIEERLLQRAKADLSRKLLDILADNSSCTISVKAPQDFCDYLKSVLPETTSVQFEPGSPELAVVIGETVIESRITEWVSDLKKACYE